MANKANTMVPKRVREMDGFISKGKLFHCNLYKTEFRVTKLNLYYSELVWPQPVLSKVFLFPTLQDTEKFLSLPKPVSSLQSECGILISPISTLGNIVCCIFVGYYYCLYRFTAFWHLKKGGLVWSLSADIL